MAYSYLIAIGLAEAVTVWRGPGYGLALYGAICLTLVGQAARARGRVRSRFCLALTLVPLVRIAGFTLPTDNLSPVAMYLISSAMLGVAAACVKHYSGLPLSEVGLCGGRRFWWAAALPLTVLALPMGLAPRFVSAPVFPSGPSSDITATIGAVAFFVSCVETMLLYGILLRVSADVLGDSGGVLYVALLTVVLQLGQPWPYALAALVLSLASGWIVLKTGTIWGVGLVLGLSRVAALLPLPLWPMVHSLITSVDPSVGWGQHLSRLPGIISPDAIGPGTLFAALMLIALLALKELTSDSEAGSRWHTLGQYVNVAVAPLLITFLLAVSIRIGAVAATRATVRPSALASPTSVPAVRQAGAEPPASTMVSSRQTPPTHVGVATVTLGATAPLIVVRSRPPVPLADTPVRPSPPPPADLAKSGGVLLNADSGSLPPQGDTWYRYDVQNKDGESVVMTIEWENSDGNTYYPGGSEIHDRLRFDRYPEDREALGAAGRTGAGVDFGPPISREVWKGVLAEGSYFVRVYNNSTREMNYTLRVAR